MSKDCVEGHKYIAYCELGPLLDGPKNWTEDVCKVCGYHIDAFVSDCLCGLGNRIMKMEHYNEEGVLIE